MKSVLAVIVVAVISYSYAGSKFAGPFNMQVKQPFVCEDEGTKDVYFINTTVRKKAKNFYAVTSTVSLKIPLDDELTLRVNFAVWGNGGWRPNFLTMDYKKACSSFSILLPGVFRETTAANDVNGCPIPKGEFAVVDADASPKVGVASLPYNKYKIYVFFLSEDGKNHGCLGMITQVVPKNTKG